MRPLWLCRVCAGPWPCATARLTLITEYAGARAALCVYLGALLHEAVADLHALNPHDAPEPRALFDWFLGRHDVGNLPHPRANSGAYRKI